MSIYLLSCSGNGLFFLDVLGRWSWDAWTKKIMHGWDTAWLRHQSCLRSLDSAEVFEGFYHQWPDGNTNRCGQTSATGRSSHRSSIETSQIRLIIASYESIPPIRYCYFLAWINMSAVFLHSPLNHFGCMEDPVFQVGLVTSLGQSCPLMTPVVGILFGKRDTLWTRWDKPCSSVTVK